jgi:predicted nucleic acid-binding Zn finger protein
MAENTNSSSLMMEQQVFDAVYIRMQKSGALSQTDKSLLLQFFRNRFTNALDAIVNLRVHKYLFTPSTRVLWSVDGKTQEYQILPSAPFCTCNDFYFRVINHEILLCYHLLAFRLARALNQYVTTVKSDQSYEEVLDRFRMPRSEHQKLSSQDIENIRHTIATLLDANIERSARELTIDIHKYGFEVTSPQHLGTILSKDKKNRFKPHKGKWHLHKE